MLFTPGRASSYPLRPLFYIDDNVIEYVESWPHLGNILNVNQSDAACILNHRNIMVGQINDVICYLASLTLLSKLNCYILTAVVFMVPYCGIYNSQS